MTTLNLARSKAIKRAQMLVFARVTMVKIVIRLADSSVGMYLEM